MTDLFMELNGKIGDVQFLLSSRPSSRWRIGVECTSPFAFLVLSTSHKYRPWERAPPEITATLSGHRRRNATVTFEHCEILRLCVPSKMAFLNCSWSNTKTSQETAPKMRLYRDVTSTHDQKQKTPPNTHWPRVLGSLSEFPL